MIHGMSDDFSFQKIQSEVSQPKVTRTNSRLSQKAILSGMIKKRKISENNGNGQVNKASEETDESESPAKKQPKIDKVVSVASDENTSVGALKCIGILPGICGSYAESSDSEKSTDTDDDYDYSHFDWVGRKKCSKDALENHGACGQ